MIFNMTSDLIVGYRIITSQFTYSFKIEYTVKETGGMSEKRNLFKYSKIDETSEESMRR